MEPFSQAESFEAIFFRADDEDKIVREMLYAEFEAILDGVVGLNDCAGREMHAIYAVIGKSLEIRALVFFLISFEEDGNADPSWNVPLHHLADIGNLGPDLGGGPVRISSKGNCNISWHEDQLWAADLGPGSALLEELRQTVLRNRLGLRGTAQVPAGTAEPAPAGQPPAATQTPASAAEAVGKEGSTRMNELLQQQVERIHRLNKQREQELDSLAASHRAEVQALEAEVNRLQGELERHQGLASKLQDQLQAQTARTAKLEAELGRRQGAGEKADGETMRKQVAEEIRGAVDKQIRELQEQLHTREAETAYLKEMESQLREELEEAREARRQLLSEGGGNILERLHKSGVVFVAYHPGVGHMPIPLKDIASYTDSPDAYVAAKCNVTEQQYREWRSHWENPVCQGKKPSGEPCGERLERVEQPARYVHGKSNLCVVCQSRGSLMSTAAVQ